MRFVAAILFGSLVCVSLAQAVEVLVKADTISISNTSAIDKDTSSNISAIYGGIAGTCATTNNTSTCNSCTNDTGTLHACNQSSIYASLPITIEFKTTKDVTSAVGKISIMNASAVEVTPVPYPTQSYVANSTVATASTTWGVLCNAVGLGNTCSQTASGVYAGKIGFGVDSDNNGTIETTEMKTVDFRIHVVGSADTANTSNGYCTALASVTPGACGLSFLAGDEKVYIGENPLVGDSEVSNVAFDAIAVFPIPVASASAGIAAITGFKTSQAVPILKEMSISSSEVNIPNSEVSGGLENYQTYCFVYGTRNRAQNIYHFVTASADSTLANNICVAPSEVVGLLEDKHCFISTAAFGSDMASEVKTFREFRNQFLLTNTLGKIFVKVYYALSPPIAGVIAKSDLLRATTRGVLYPFLAFSSIALKYGFAVALLALIALLILIFRIKSVVKQKGLLLFLFVLMLTPLLKAQITPKTTVIQYPEAAQEGLVRITQDGTYIYDIKREMKSESNRISFGHALQPEVTIEVEKRDPTTGAGTGQFQTYDFGDLYEETSSVIIGYEYERFPWVGTKGKLGFQLGGSLMFAQGHGIIVAAAGDTTKEKSQEKYTFFTFPLTAGAVYRLEWKDKQFFAPYVAGGGTYTALIEKREDKSAPQFTGAPGFYGAGGVLFNLSQLNDDEGFALDSEYGISNLWLSLEFKAIEVNSDSFTFSNQYVNLGISFDF